MTLDAVAVREKLARLAGLDVKGAWPVDERGYWLRPVVDDTTLVRAEQLIGMPLPDDYRYFLTTVGDGGAGPYYGVFPLAEALNWVDLRYDGLDSLGRDCPLTADIDIGELTGQPDGWDEHVARLDSDPEYVAHFERLTETYSQRPWIDGKLPIANYGCGDWFFLVVRGPRRGTIWVDSLESSTGLFCLEIDFATFYQRWLDTELIRAPRGESAPNAHFAFLQYGDNPRYRLV